MSMAVVAAVAAPLVIGGISAIISQSKANAAEADIQNAQSDVDRLLQNRQDVYNAADDIRDMKSMVTNPYSNLGVAMGAAKIQMEQTDIALANTLDALSDTGSSGGGATALARAAAQSKKQVSADIEKQEATNLKLQAQGEQQMNQQLMAIEQAAIGANQQAWAAKESREQAGIDRAYGQLDFEMNQQQAYQDAAQAALMSGLSGSTSALTGAVGPGGAMTTEGGWG
jgi:hypothetical protein